MVNDILSIVSVIIVIGGVIGGAFAYRNSFGRNATSIQQVVIEALNARVEDLQRQVTEAKEQAATQAAAAATEIQRLKGVIQAIQIAFKRKGTAIEIEDDAVTLIEEQPQQRQTKTIRIPLPKSNTQPENNP